MLRSTDRIRTTHVGSLARPPTLLDLMRAAAQGRPVEEAELAETAASLLQSPPTTMAADHDHLSGGRHGTVIRSGDR